MTADSLLRKPSAAAPLVMSLIGLAIVIGHYAMFGLDHDPDEGTPAHIFQILMVAQLPLILVFAAKYLPENPKRGAAVLALQALAMGAAFAGVYFLT